jgi:hypothetical protein
MRGQVLLLSGLALAACKGERAAPALPPMPADAVRTSGPHFHVDAAAAAACAPGATCTVLAELTALDDYKVNKDYPFRFHLAPGSGFTLEGEPRFQVHSTHIGRLTVQARRGADAAPFAGNLKLSVCSADECLVETAALSVNIP